MLEFLDDPSFQYFAALINEACKSEEWRNRHPKVRFQERRMKVNAAIEDGIPLADPITNLLLPLFVSREDHPIEHLVWLMNVVKNERGLRLIVPAMMATACLPFGYLTLKEVAEATGMSESPWRTRCQNGEVPGAEQAGGVWLIPKLHLVREGYR